MMTLGSKIFIFSVAILVGTFSFRQLEEKPLLSEPSNFPKPVYHFKSNALTDEGVALGKTLFYDATLSKDNSISCGSCHQQSAGFTQHGHELSHGVNDQFTKRNSMPLFNLAWANSFGWDGGVHDLDFFAISPIQNPVEMDELLGNVLEKLRKSNTYPALFEKAYGSKEINTERFLKALSQFMLTMVSANSKYDKVVRSEGLVFTQEEEKGLALFDQKCSVCHSGELFTDFKFRNNGLKLDRNDDMGRYEVTQLEEDKFKFKVPSLRNLTATAPYMHDGRFKTLEEVLDHYEAKLENSPTLDPILKKDGKIGIAMTAEEKKQIIAFLKTLDDEDFLTDPRFAESTATVATKKKTLEDDIVDLKAQNATFNTGLQKSIVAYLKIKEALLAKNSSLVSSSTSYFLNTIDITNGATLSNTQKEKFKKWQENLTFNGTHIIEGKGNLPHQVEHFSELSKIFYVLIASFKPNTETLYFYSKGSSDHWLSDKENEKNWVILKNTPSNDNLQVRTIAPKK